MSTNLQIHITGNDGGVDVDGTLMLFSITNEEPAYTVSKLELLIGSVRIVFNSPVVFPVNISLGLVQGIVDSIGDYPISVRAYDSNNTIRMIDQSAMISVLDDSVQIVTPQELPVIVDITEATPQPDPEPEPTPEPEPEPEVESGDTYYDDETGYSYIYDGNDYIRIAYHNDAPKSHTHGNGDITDIDASKITSGTVNIARLPAGSLERLYPVATLSEMYQLTTDDVQNGDTVQVNNGIMYLVVDDTNLDNSSGYKEYTAGRATAVDWSGVENPPATYAPSAHDHDSSYAPLSHTHTGSEITSAVETANKLGSTNVGNSNKPIYLNAGTATPVYQDIDPFDIPFFTVGEPSRLIAGSAMTEGYFGEVDGANFIYPWEVLAQIKSMNVSTLADFKTGFTSAYGSNISYAFTGDSYTALEITDNLECPWLKFYSRGKIIFVSKRPILNNITWNDINTMLGDVNAGFDIKIDTNRLNSNYDTTYENGRYAILKCRLLTGANNQSVAIGNIYDRGKSGVELGRGSEWNRLMYRICSQIPTDTNAGALNGNCGGKQIGDNWAENTAQSLGFGASNDLGRYTWCQEYGWYQNTAFGCCQHGSEYGVGFMTCNVPSNRATHYGFRPALVFDCNPQMNIVQVSSVPAVQASNTLYIITQ